MASKQAKSALRLRKRHTPAERVTLDAADGRLLVQQQSLRDAIVGGLIVIILFSILWSMLTTLLDRIFPWMTVLLGVFTGLVIRRAGRGVDWRFPTLAAVMTLLGALLGIVVVAASFTAEEFDTTTFMILRAVTSMTWPVFFDEVISAVDIVFAAFGAATAAFFASRRLSRAEYHALRKWQEEKAGAGRD